MIQRNWYCQRKNLIKLLLQRVRQVGHNSLWVSSRRLTDFLLKYLATGGYFPVPMHNQISKNESETKPKGKESGVIYSYINWSNVTGGQALKKQFLMLQTYLFQLLDLDYKRAVLQKLVSHFLLSHRFYSSVTKLQ